MHFPGFKAEASLYKSNELYRANGISFGAEGAVEPARKGFPSARCATTSAQAAPLFATGGVLVHVAAARTAAILIDRNCWSAMVPQREGRL